MRFLLILSFVLPALTFAATPPNQKGCEPSLAVGTPVTDLSGNFNPRKIWRDIGMDPDKISIVVKDNRNGAGFDSTPSVEFFLKYESQTVGVLDLYDRGDGVWGTYSGLEDAYRDKKIGSLMYLIGAEVVFRLYPEAVALESFDGSVDANYMWEKLVRHQRASKSPQDEDEAQPRFVYRIERGHINPRLKAYVNNVKARRLRL